MDFCDTNPLQEVDIVEIEKTSTEYEITFLKDETTDKSIVMLKDMSGAVMDTL